MFILVHLLSVDIFGNCFQWDSKLKNIPLFLHSIDNYTRSGFSAVTRKLWRTVHLPGRVWDGTSAYIKNRSISINPVIYLIRLLCLQKFPIVEGLFVLAGCPNRGWVEISVYLSSDWTCKNSRSCHIFQELPGRENVQLFYYYYSVLKTYGWMLPWFLEWSCRYLDTLGTWLYR